MPSFFSSFQSLFTPSPPTSSSQLSSSSSLPSTSNSNSGNLSSSSSYQKGSGYQTGYASNSMGSGHPGGGGGGAGGRGTGRMGNMGAYYEDAWDMNQGRSSNSVSPNRDFNPSTHSSNSTSPSSTSTSKPTNHPSSSSSSGGGLNDSTNSNSHLNSNGYHGDEHVIKRSSSPLDGSVGGRGRMGNGGQDGVTVPGKGYIPSRQDSPSTSRQNSLTPGYQYPPVGGGAGGGNRPRAGSNIAPRARHASNQPFLSPNGPLIYYPPLNQTWSRIKRTLSDHLPELADTLNYPVDNTTLTHLETQFGVELPPSVRDSYLCVDGQDQSSELKEGLFFGLTLLSLEDVLREWEFWRRVDADPSTGQNPEVLAMMGSIPPGWIRPKYASKGWIPLITDKCGNYVGVDLDPGSTEEYSMTSGSDAGQGGGGVNRTAPANEGGQNGSWGQVIMFGREFDRKVVLWRGEGEGGWGRWLAGFAEELESGEGWEIDGSEKRGSDGEEDDIGYSSYYCDSGSGGRGGDSYGEGGSGLRLTGEYRGWNVLEAWWDRSVRKWDELGMGVTASDLQRDEQYRMEKARKGKYREGDEAFGMRKGNGNGGGYDYQNGLAPLTPGPETSLLGPRSPEHGSDPSSIQGQFANLQVQDSSQTHHSPSPRRLVTPLAPGMSPEEDPLSPGYRSSSPSSNLDPRKRDGLLSPPSFAHSRQSNSSTNKRVSMTLANMPPPEAIDLPTRADVQAAQAVAIAEETGIRGGWVMSMESVSSAKPSLASRRSTLSSIANSLPTRRSPSPSPAAEDGMEMVDIDLEGGKLERFGSPGMTEAEARREDAIRSESNQTPPVRQPIARTPSPLSIQTINLEQPTPRMAANHRRISYQRDYSAGSSEPIDAPTPTNRLGNRSPALSTVSDSGKSATPQPDQEDAEHFDDIDVDGPSLRQPTEQQSKRNSILGRLTGN